MMWHKESYGDPLPGLFSPHIFKKAMSILQSPPSVCPSVTLSPPKPFDKIQPNLVCELLT